MRGQGLGSMRKLLMVSVLALVALTGCGGGWSKTAGATTCADWINVMNVDQRQLLAQALLSFFWTNDGAAQEPPDATVTQFGNAIGTLCADPQASGAGRVSISTAGTFVYESVSSLRP